MLYGVIVAVGFVAACWFALSMRILSSARHYWVIYTDRQSVFMIGGVVAMVLVNAVAIATIFLGTSPWPGFIATIFSAGFSAVLGLAGWQGGKRHSV